MGWASGGEASALVFVDAPLDDQLAITGDDGHHLARVLRLEPGEAVTVADGSGRWRPFRIDAVSNGIVHLRAEGAVVTEPELVPRLAVAFAMTKGHKPETVVDRLTQLGVDRILAVTTERSIARWSRAQRDAKLDRLRRVARRGLDAVPPRPASRGGDRRCARRSHRPPGPGGRRSRRNPTGSVSRRPVPRAGSSWWVPKVGSPRPSWPQMGTAPRVGLGPHVLRAETAALAAAAVLGVHRRSRIGHAG